MVLKATAVAFVGIQILEKKRAGDAGPKAVSCADIGQSIMCSQCCLCLMMDIPRLFKKPNFGFSAQSLIQ